MVVNESLLQVERYIQYKKARRNICDYDRNCQDICHHTYACMYIGIYEYVCVCMFPLKGPGRKKNLIVMNIHIIQLLYTIIHQESLREKWMILELRNKTKLNLVDDVLSESKEKLKYNVDT